MDQRKTNATGHGHDGDAEHGKPPAHDGEFLWVLLCAKRELIGTGGAGCLLMRTMVAGRNIGVASGGTRRDTFLCHMIPTR